MRLPKAVWGIVLAIIVVGTLSITMYFVQTIHDKELRNSLQVPSEIAKKLDFSPFVVVPGDGSPRTANYSVDIPTDNKLQDDILYFKYDLITNTGKSVAISQQSQPASFTDIPELKNKVLTDSIQQQYSVSTSAGTIYVGMMTAQKNKQLAVMVERGLIVFLYPSERLEQREWREIGDSLDVVKLR